MILFLIVGLIAIALIVMYTAKQQRTVNTILAQNKDVMPLLKQKSAELHERNLRKRGVKHFSYNHNA